MARWPTRWADSDRRRARRATCSSEREDGRSVVAELGEQAAVAQERHHAFAEPVRLLEVRVARQDELVEAELRGTRRCGPRPRRRSRRARCRRRRAPARCRPRRSGRRRVSRSGRRRAARPSVVGRRTAWRRSPAARRRSLGRSMPATSSSATAHAVGASGRAITWKRMPKRSVRPASAASVRMRSTRSADHVGRLAPGEVHVDVLGGDPLGGVGRARRSRRRGRDRAARGSSRRRPGSACPAKSNGVPAPGAPHHLEELAGLLVARLLVLVDAEAGELGRLGAGDDVRRAGGRPTAAGTSTPSARRAWA